METWPQTKILHEKTQILLPPTVLRFYVPQTLPNAKKTGHLGKSGYAWVAVTLGRCKPTMRKKRTRTKTQMPRGAPLTHDLGAIHQHTVATLFGALCNPWTPTGLQPSAQNPSPTPQQRHPRQPNLVTVTGLGGNGNRHPCQPGSTRTAVTAAVKLRVAVAAAVDCDPASPKGRVGLDSIPSSAWKLHYILDFMRH